MTLQEKVATFTMLVRMFSDVFTLSSPSGGSSAWQLSKRYKFTTVVTNVICLCLSYFFTIIRDHVAKLTPFFSWSDVVPCNFSFSHLDGRSSWWKIRTSDKRPTTDRLSINMTYVQNVRKDTMHRILCYRRTESTGSGAWLRSRSVNMSVSQRWADPLKSKAPPWCSLKNSPRRHKRSAPKVPCLTAFSAPGAEWLIALFRLLPLNVVTKIVLLVCQSVLVFRPGQCWASAFRLSSFLRAFNCP